MQAVPCESRKRCKWKRSLSLARRVKTRLRSNMGQKRFNAIAVLNSHKERTENLRIIDDVNKLVEVNDTSRDADPYRDYGHLT